MCMCHVGLLQVRCMRQRRLRDRSVRCLLAAVVCFVFLVECRMMLSLFALPICVVMLWLGPLGAGHVTIYL